MKVYNITFKGHQPFKAEQLIVAASEEDAREGATTLLEPRVPGFEIEKVEDITKLDATGTTTELTLN